MRVIIKETSAVLCYSNRHFIYAFTHTTNMLFDKFVTVSSNNACATATTFIHQRSGSGETKKKAKKDIEYVGSKIHTQ